MSFVELCHHPPKELGIVLSSLERSAPGHSLDPSSVTVPSSLSLSPAFQGKVLVGHLLVPLHSTRKRKVELFNPWHVGVDDRRLRA